MLQRAIATASPYLVFDQGTVNRDRGQRVFGQIFTTFSDRRWRRRTTRAKGGQQKMRQYANAFERAEKEYGVPPAVIAAFWALESDFGVGMGNLPVAALAGDAGLRLPAPRVFREELMAALKIIDRGDLTPEEMIGSWAGELGQTQFLPTHYLNYAVDYDGDGRRNLMRSVPDVIGSTADFIARRWRRGEPWLQEVRVPPNLPWDQADLSHPASALEVGELGRDLPDGRPLPADNLPASLLLPMGRFGPAFLAYPNFPAYTEWNKSLNYATTAAHLATRIAGAPPMRRPRAGRALSPAQIKELQQLLARAGFDDGEIDGMMGQQSRIAVKTQAKHGLPADAWPTAELLTRIRAEPERLSSPPASTAQQIITAAPSQQHRRGSGRL